MTTSPHTVGSRLAETMGTVRPHPVVSAMQFNKTTEETGGATMNVHTHKFTGIGDSGYGVGGAADDHGNRIPSHEHAGSPTLGSTLDQMQRVKSASRSNPNANVGSWKNDSGNTDYDASEVISSRSHAERVGRARGEAAIFDYKHGSDIRTDN